MTDLLLIERGSGGDLNIQANDIEVITGFENLPYISMFSGNGVWWANALLLSDIQFVSETGEALKNNALTSIGRANIERAINNDLSFLSEITGTKYTLSVTITNPDRLSVVININGKTFSFYWQPSTQYINYSI